MVRSKLKKEDINRPVTLGVLLEYTDEVLLPRMEEMVNTVVNEVTQKKTGQLEYNLKVYIDEKLANYTSDIFKRLEKRDINDKHFKVKVVELFKKHHIGSEKELAFLEGMVSGV